MFVRWRSMARQSHRRPPIPTRWCCAFSGGDGFVLYENGKNANHRGGCGQGWLRIRRGRGPNRGPLRPRPRPPRYQRRAQRSVSQPTAPHVPTPPPTSWDAGGATISGGSDLYRIHTDGFPERSGAIRMTSLQHRFRRQRPRAYRHGKQGLHLSHRLRRALHRAAHSAPTQVTAFLPAPNGKIYAATGNVGKSTKSDLPRARGFHRIRPYLTPAFSRSGPLKFKGAANGGR